MNGDGVPDVIAGWSLHDGGVQTRDAAGTSYVVFGVPGDTPGGEPEIGLSRSGTAVQDGSTDDLGTVSTDFQAVRYTITNSGDVTLNLGQGTVGNGSNMDDLQVLNPPPATLGPGGEASIDVAFDPVFEGPISFDVSIENDDADENPYNFTVTGQAAGTAPTFSAELSPPVILLDNDADGRANPSDTIRANSVRLNIANDAFNGDVFFDLQAPEGTQLVAALPEGLLGDRLVSFVADLDAGTIDAHFINLGLGSFDLLSFDLLIENETLASSVDLQGAFTAGPQTILTDNPTTAASPDATVVPLGSLSRLQPDAEAGQFGTATDLSEQFAVVGSPGDDAGAGAVTIYGIEPDGIRQLISRLTPPAGFGGVGVGNTVSLDGDVLAVGSLHDGSSAKGAVGSKVTLYRLLTGSQPDLLAQVTGNLNGNGFGSAVELDGNTLIVGAPEEDEGATVDAGAVYLYAVDNLIAGEPEPDTRLTDTSPQDQSRFGAAIDCADGKLAVGAPGPVGGGNAGRAAIFDLIRGTSTGIDAPFWRRWRVWRRGSDRGQFNFCRLPRCHGWWRSLSIRSVRLPGWSQACTQRCAEWF